MGPYWTVTGKLVPQKFGPGDLFFCGKLVHGPKVLWQTGPWTNFFFRGKLVLAWSPQFSMEFWSLGPLSHEKPLLNFIRAL